MALVDKMAILGVRSYSTQEPSVIKFFTPLTLIVGSNGAGKTTVIESLRYVTTGDMPPGTKNAAFIHDPKVAGEKEVKGQVKLKFKDVTGNDCCVIRSMNSVQKLKKTEARSLEGLIQIVDKNKQKRSISNRCADLTREMVIRLGVSKAIIENVIFCHQEESNWPLSEGKALKQKFDEIFSATRYIKALENIRSLRKEQVSTVKTYGTELSYLRQNKDKADEIAEELQKTQEKTDRAKVSIKSLDEKVIPLEVQLAEMDCVASEVADIEREISNYDVTITQLKKTANTLDDNIIQRFQGSLSELERILSEFKEKGRDKETSTEQLERRLQNVERELKANTAETTELLQRKGKLEQEADIHKRNLIERNKFISELAEKHDIQGFSGSDLSSEDVDNFLQMIKAEYQGVVEKGKSEKENVQRQISDLDKRIENLNQSKHDYQGTIRIKKDLLLDNKRTIKSIKDELTEIEGSSSKLHNLELELNQAQRDLEEAKTTFNYNQVNDEIDSLRIKKKTLDEELRSLRAEKDRIHLNSSTQAKIDHMEKEKVEKQRDIEMILKRHEDALTNMFDVQPSVDTLKDKVVSFKREKERELRNTMEKLQALNKDLASKDANKRMYQDQVKEKEAYITEFDLKVSEVCGENDYNVAREKAQADFEKFNTTLAEIGAFEKIYKKYVNQLRDNREQEKGCPLCHRKFDTSKDLYALVEELEQRLTSVPDKRHQTERSVDKEKRKLDVLEKLGHEKAVCDSMKDDLPPLREKLRDLSKVATTLRSQLEELEEVKALLHHEESSARDMEADIRNIDKYQYDLTDLDRKIGNESSKLQGQGTGKTMQQVTRECQEKDHEIDSIGRKIEMKNKQIIDGQQHVSRIERMVNDLQSQKLNISSKMQRKGQLEEQKADLLSKSQAYEREIREAESKLDPIQDSINDIQSQRQDLESKKDKVTEETRNKLEKIKGEGNKIREKNSEITRYIKDGKELSLQENRNELEIIYRTHSNLTKKKEDFATKINEAKEDFAKHQIRARELEDNLALKKTEIEIKEVEGKIEDARRKLKDIGGTSGLIRQRGELQKELDEIRKDKAAQEGRLRGYEDELRRCQRELRSDIYAGAEKKHKEKMIQLRTTELANQDLDKFYKALDRAIMRFHNVKMTEINKIIKEYWIHAYQGRDIDTIEIRADEDEASGASSARRTFNYRVVMMKGDTPLDMRSRCSAGQKVLASIIIRLALAETFCLNCGILALDEPTTNLDGPNVESLANELKKIIHARQRQKNFQLIIISHDEEFIRSLGRQDYVDHYYRIYKENGVSRIHRRSTMDSDMD